MKKRLLGLKIRLERTQKKEKTEQKWAIHPGTSLMLSLLQSLVDERGTTHLQQWCPSDPVVVLMITYRIIVQYHKEGHILYCYTLW